MTGTTRVKEISEILPKEFSPDFLLNGADESHEYLGTEPRFKFRGRCKPAKPQLTIFREFIGGPGSDDIAYTRYNRLSLGMLKDGLGSTIALTSKDGKAIARIGYDAWGEFRWNDKNCKKSPCKENQFESYLKRFGSTWSFGHANHNGWAFGKSFAKKLTPYLYTGRRYSEITNQYFNRNRYYSPALGRFILKDPIGFYGDINLYRYADNNPLIYTVPWGLFSARDGMENYWGVDGKPGEPININFKNVRTYHIHLTQFPSIWKEINRKRCEDTEIEINELEHFSAKLNQILLLGTIGVRLKGKLKINKDSTWSFNGKLIGSEDDYGFERGDRGLVGETLAGIGRLFLHGISYKIRFYGSQKKVGSGSLPATKVEKHGKVTIYWKEVWGL